MMIRKLRKTVSMLLAVVLAISVLQGIQGAEASAEEAVLTVSEAIADNNGTAAVEGYIVAHTTGNNTYDFTAPFANDYNLALADSAAETDKANLLPVQLTAAYRGEFGLLTNPENIGRKIRVTGSLEAYFTVPGLKNPSSIAFADGSGEPAPGPISATIAEARLMTGQTVRVEGIVTADNAAIGGANLSTYIQDDTGGINVFSFTPSQFPELHEGDLIRVTGTIAQYRGLAEIMPETDGIEMLQSGRPLPEPKPLTIEGLNDPLQAEDVEGQLAVVRGYVQSVPASPAGGGYYVTLIDGEFRGTTLRIMENALDIQLVRAGIWYDITAIVSQYDSFQLLPRKAADIVRVEPQPEAPSAAGEYESAIAAVVDGDTVNLTSPVLGTTRVRLLNIDTAETFHTPVTEADANQKSFGEAAKAYMNTLLAPGDEVVLRVGEEPMDAYGRLLAEVVRKSDGMNVNLEMVAKGHATTYFIWPIGSEFELYSQTVKAAYAARLGIWNESFPLLELPFLFRARYDGRPLSRYVGDYFMKRYVLPEEWNRVPVEARVFFESALEAEENGYLPEDNTAPEIRAPQHIAVKQYEELQLTIEAHDALSGVREMTATLDGHPVEHPIAVEPFELETGLHSIVVSAFDYAGNEASAEIVLEVLEIDLEGLDELLQYGVAADKVNPENSDSLMSKIEQAQQAPNGTCRNKMLNALINQIRALSDKKIETSFAEWMETVVSNLLK